jgi:hypothetical protein
MFFDLGPSSILGAHHLIAAEDLATAKAITHLLGGEWPEGMPLHMQKPSPAGIYRP